ncbi:hypothetical protein ACFY84_26080 [Streptomyces sp. NPDC012438]|uniref:hypothetical protein n=1 Tax=Streptomyces sp. NPDC012438 TaxID=3364833 RepID=UPI0036F10449
MSLRLTARVIWLGSAAARLPMPRLTSDQMPSCGLRSGVKGVPQEGPAGHLDLLAEHTPVGFSDRMGQVQAFLGKDKELPSPIESL